MDNTVDIVATAIAGASAIVALVSSVVVSLQARKSLHVNILSTQRLTWAENLRNAVADFAFAYYEGKDLRACRDRVLLYLTLGASYDSHKSLARAMDSVISGDCKSIENVIDSARQVLRDNWWAVKSEAEVSAAEEKRRDELIRKRRALHAGEQRKKEAKNHEV